MDNLPSEVIELILRKKHQVELEDCLYEIKNCIIRMRYSSTSLKSIEFAPEHEERHSSEHTSFNSYYGLSIGFACIKHIYLNRQLDKQCMFNDYHMYKMVVSRDRPFSKSTEYMYHRAFFATVPHMSVNMLKTVLIENGFKKSKINKRKNLLVEMIFKIE